MTKIVLDLKDDLGDVCDELDYGQAQTSLVVGRLLTALRAAQGKRWVVLDVDELGLDSEPNRVAMQEHARIPLSTAGRLSRAVLDELDALTPPRPEEPKALLAHVRCSTDEEWVRYALDSHCTHPWARLGPVGLDLTETVNWRELNNVDGVVEVLSPGVGGGA